MAVPELSPETYRRAREGDQASKQTIIDANMGMANRIARRGWRSWSCLEHDDLVQEAVLGILRAIETYDPSSGYKFLTYATHWMRNRVQRAVLNTGRLVRAPISETERFAEHAAMTTSAVLYTGSGIDGSILDIATSPPADEPPTDRHEELSRSLAVLPKRERDLLALRYGLEGEPLTLEAVGAIIGLSRERVRQLEMRALETARTGHRPSCRETMALLPLRGRRGARTLEADRNRKNARASGTVKLG